MNEPRALALAGRAVIGLALVWVATLLVVFALRVAFPLELEWMEGGVVHQAMRLQRGEPLYPPPTSAFVPFLYTPLYPIVLGVLGFVFPLGLVLGRVVSILAWAAIGAGLWRAVAREMKPTSHRAAAVGLWCAGYVFGFRWIDLARPDALFLALTLWSLVLLRESWGHWRRAALAGLLMALAFWTKQTAAALVIASGIAGLLVAPRQLWAYVAVIAVVDGGGVLVGNAMSDGWLWTYIYELHQSHAFNDERFTRKTWGMFVHAAPMLTVLVALVGGSFLRPWLVRSRKLDRADDRRASARLSAHRGLIYWGIIAAGAALVSALGYSTQWAEPNAFLPGICFGALWLAVALPERGSIAVIGLGLVAAQLVFSLVVEPMYQPIQNRGLAGLSASYRWQDPARTIPSERLRTNAAAMHQRLAGSRAEVFALQRPWWNIVAGGEGHVGAMGLADVAPGDRRAIEQAIVAAVRGLAYDEIWFEGEPPAWIRPALRGRYSVSARLQGDDRIRPMSGYLSEAGMVTPHRADEVQFVPIVARSIAAGTQVFLDFEDGTLQGTTTHGGFGRRPVSGFTGELPQPAGTGGEFWLSSAGPAGRLEERGSADTPAIPVAAGAHLEASVAVLGEVLDADTLTLEVVDADGSALARLELPQATAVMTTVSWTSDAARIVTVRLRDDATAAAIALDDLCVRAP